MSVIREIKKVIEDLERFKDDIERALGHWSNTHTFDDVCSSVLQKQVAFWPLENSFLITEIVVYPQQRHLHIWLAGGDLDEIKAMQHSMVQHAKENGCSIITLSGRAGWVKALEDIGWKPGLRVVYYEVEEA